jgi:ribosomal protein L11 methyltransferase
VRYVELAFTVPEGEAELEAERLREAGAAGVELRDGETLEKAPPGNVLLVVWVDPARAEELVARVGRTPARRERDEGEWRELWKQFFRPQRIGKFVIVPSWEDWRGEGLKLDLDPGRAFGTGQHASTRLCLELLGEEQNVGSFLDVGCGSGVLAIGCKKLWPEARGRGMDVDPDAVEVSRENASRNRVDIDFSTEISGGPYDLVLANIQPEVLIPLAPRLTALTARTLILSGILIEAAESVVAAYPELRLMATRDLDGWRALVLRRG